MSDKRISVRGSTRSRLNARKEQNGSTYSEEIRKIIPDPEREDVFEHEDHDTRLVTLSVDGDAYNRVAGLAGHGVALREVIEFYLYLDELDGSVSPKEILVEVYRNEGK
jgi:hypothetical protein